MISKPSLMRENIIQWLRELAEFRLPGFESWLLHQITLGRSVYFSPIKRMRIVLCHKIVLRIK